MAFCGKIELKEKPTEDLMKKTLAIFIFTAAASCMNAGCGSSNNSGNVHNQGRYQGQNYQYQSNTQRQYNRYSQDSQNQTDDQKMTTDFQKYLKDSDKYSNVKATVSNGYVTLTGTVQTQEDKNAIEKKVRETKGVQGINSQITVQSQSNYQNRNY